jgi:hypothetical protein
MAFYGVIANARINEVVERPPSLSMHIVALGEMEVTGSQKRGLDVTCVSEGIPHAIQQLSPYDRLHCIHQGFHMSPKIVVQSR